jgi:threonine aldolase
MRQAGVLAAACLYALDHHVERICEDHDNAQRLAAGLRALEGIEVEPVQSNMVFIDVSGTGLDAKKFNESLFAHGIRMSVQGKFRLRAVTHLDISQDDIDTCIGAIAALVAPR